MRKTITTVAIATAIAGTLDILSAFLFASLKGISPEQVLRYVASGPFGDAMRHGRHGAALLGLLVHYVLMAAMVSVFVVGSTRMNLRRQSWPGYGALYGLLIYGIMYWLVLPTRFGTFPSVSPAPLAAALFSHILCVGLPIAFICQPLMATERAGWMHPAGDGGAAGDR